MRYSRLMSMQNQCPKESTIFNDITFALRQCVWALVESVTPCRFMSPKSMFHLLYQSRWIAVLLESLDPSLNIVQWWNTVVYLKYGNRSQSVKGLRQRTFHEDLRAGFFLKFIHTKRKRYFQRFRASLHRTKTVAKAKRSKKERQTSKKLFAFASTFTQCEWAFYTLTQSR